MPDGLNPAISMSEVDTLARNILRRNNRIRLPLYFLLYNHLPFSLCCCFFFFEGLVPYQVEHAYSYHCNFRKSTLRKSLESSLHFARHHVLVLICTGWYTFNDHGGIYWTSVFHQCNIYDNLQTFSSYGNKCHILKVLIRQTSVKFM